MKERQFHKIIIELCKELNIEVKKISYDWILELSKDEKVFHIVGNNFDLNSESSGKIACDKYATYEVLKNAGVPIIEHTMLFNPEKRSKYTSKEKNRIILLKEHIKNKVLVVKQNNGRAGRRSLFEQKYQRSGTICRKVIF